MESVEWIFTDYKAHRSMLQFLQEELAQLNADCNSPPTDEDISSMILSRPALDGMPRKHSFGSSTEWAVMKINHGDHNHAALLGFPVGGAYLLHPLLNQLLFPFRDTEV